MVRDDLAAQGALASAAMVLTKFSMNILALTPEGIDLYRKLLLNEYMNIYIHMIVV